MTLTLSRKSLARFSRFLQNFLVALRTTQLYARVVFRYQMAGHLITSGSGVSPRPMLRPGNSVRKACSASAPPVRQSRTRRLQTRGRGPSLLPGRICGAERKKWFLHELIHLLFKCSSQSVDTITLQQGMQATVSRMQTPFLGIRTNADLPILHTSKVRVCRWQNCSRGLCLCKKINKYAMHQLLLS